MPSNYGIALAAHLTNKDGIFHDGCKITCVPQNDIQGVDKLKYNLNIDLSQFLTKKKTYVV